MIREFFASLIFFLILVLPAYPIIAPEKPPVSEAEKIFEKISSILKQVEKVIVIRTAKDPQVTITTVGEKGEIMVPQSREKTITSAPEPPRPAQAAAPPPTSGPGAEDEKDSDKLKAKGGASGATVGSVSTGTGKEQAPTSPYSASDSNLGGVFGGAAALGFASADSTSEVVYPTLPTAQLQALLNKSVGSGTGIPGAIMAVQTTWGTWIGAAGTADLTAARPMTTSMQVSLAAGTKIFTAALIMRLTEAAKLALTDTVEKWLPGQVVPGGDKTAAEKITVGMLLNHTSGIHDHETTQQFEDRLFAAPTASWSNDDVLAIINAYALDFTPGAAYGYCNSNYYLLGMIAEAATGDTVENLMQARFFSPLGLSRTTLSRGGQKTAPFSRGYCWFGIPLYPDLTDTTDWDLSWDWTSGSGASTAKNMLTWLKALFGDLQVVSRKSLILMTTPQAPSTAYGYGLAVVNSDPWYNEKLYYHYGENPGVLARWFYYPTSGRIIFLSFNRDDKRFLSTDPPQQVDVNPVADNLLAGVSKLLISTGSQ